VGQRQIRRGAPAENIIRAKGAAEYGGEAANARPSTAAKGPTAPAEHVIQGCFEPGRELINWHVACACLPA